MKTFEEIMDGIPDRITYSRHAVQLASLALTKFAEEITQKGATILRCSPKQIKLDDGTIIKVVGSWMIYTYNNGFIYSIQFNDNPFFCPEGYIMNELGQYTGSKEIPIVFNGVNEYSVEKDNIEKLKENIYIAEDYLREFSMYHHGKYNLKQEIYYI